MLSTIRILAAVLCLCIWPAISPAADKDKPSSSSLPRYRLTPGRVIHYRTESVAKILVEKDGKSQTVEIGERHDWTFWVLRANKDGSARVLIRDVDHWIPMENGKESAHSRIPYFAYADIFPDGRILPNPTIRYFVNPSGVMPQLPKDADEAAAGWETTVNGTKISAKPVPGDEFRFVTTTASESDKAYLSSNRRTYTFDPKRGLITVGDMEYTQSYKRKTKSSGTLKLDDEEKLDEEGLARLSADADQYFAATAAYDDAVEKAGKLSLDKARATAEQAGAKLKAAAETVNWPELRSALAKRVKEHERNVDGIVSSAERRAAVVGKPAFAFEATDLNDKPVTLADFKGKVIVLDFWFRGCGWCIKAMPQVNELSAEFAGQPVVVIGMNTDEDKADAEHVVKELGLKYQTLRIKHSLAEKFGVRGFPTLIVIDQKGVLREVHVGYSPTLREDVAKVVRDLLAEK